MFSGDTITTLQLRDSTPLLLLLLLPRAISEEIREAIVEILEDKEVGSSEEQNETPLGRSGSSPPSMKSPKKGKNTRDARHTEKQREAMFKFAKRERKLV